MPQFSLKWPPVTQIAPVLCIIILMAAILSPMFQTVPHPHHSYCQSNLKQLGLAYAQYEQDEDDVCPPGINATGNGWAGQLYPYIKSVGVYRCSDDAHDSAFISYAENRNLAGQKLKTLTNCAATVTVYEFSTLNCDPSMPETVSATGISAPQDSTRHDAKTFGLNFLMADGHTQWLLPAQISGGPGAVSPKTLPSGKMIRTFAVK